MTEHRISESSIERHMVHGLPADIAWPIAVETELRLRRVRFKSKGAIFRHIDLEEPYELSFDLAGDTWILNQP